jgi:hypothetical protein
MGLFFVLILYAVIFSILAFVGAIVLGGFSYVLTRHAWPKSKRLVIASALFPFLCVIYAGGCFATYAVTNWKVFHRDPGLGDGWFTPLPNGYSLSMVDITDQGSIYSTVNPDGQSVEDGVRQLQVYNNLIFGARDQGYFGRIGQSSSVVDSYFLLDTSDKSKTEFSSLEQLRQQAHTRGVTLNLRTFDAVFSYYRYTWFDVLALAVLFLVPGTAFLFLMRWIWKTRNSSPQLPESTTTN